MQYVGLLAGVFLRTLGPIFSYQVSRESLGTRQFLSLPIQGAPTSPNDICLAKAISPLPEFEAYIRVRIGTWPAGSGVPSSLMTTMPGAMAVASPLRVETLREANKCTSG